MRTIVQDAVGVSCACRHRMRPWQGYNSTGESLCVRPHGAPLAAISFLLLMCNELCRYALHDACSTASLLHARVMLDHHLSGLLHSCWQVLRAQR